MKATYRTTPPTQTAANNSTLAKSLSVFNIVIADDVARPSDHSDDQLVSPLKRSQISYTAINHAVLPFAFFISGSLLMWFILHSS